MTGRLVIAGGGEHARVVAEAAAAAGWELTGYTDAPGDPDGQDPAGRRTAPPGLPRLGTDDELAASLAAIPPEQRPWLVLGFGPSPGRRRAVATFGPDARWATVVHPFSWISPSATLSPGAVVLAAAVINAGATVGDHAIVNSGAVVEHDVTLGCHVHVAPRSVIGGGASVGDDAVIGVGAAVRDHVSVGAGATVAMGAVAIADVPDGALVLGVPARARPGEAPRARDGDGVGG